MCRGSQIEGGMGTWYLRLCWRRGLGGRAPWVQDVAQLSSADPIVVSGVRRVAAILTEMRRLLQHGRVEVVHAWLLSATYSEPVLSLSIFPRSISRNTSNGVHDRVLANGRAGEESGQSSAVLALGVVTIKVDCGHVGPRKCRC